ncbi:bifunctional 4-hydroxy-3-methylbut-2-enyl diphosphate reductase/30S ribosomal protein S1 [Heliorestis acidaminivorans]|uniref:4-hydroxy-3-methylbut-2-enyl diphosphate reductase n=1 Tax=Heliorestis acidaminivorans TaxID=553427 RepID=A0A6I0EV23_9FIRM|nr:bifunctional 4-hydroxy-3-methylbut-2-enyl diphosphate reductase/30S ribosomal protein S1 [Heliorestis acidaminivorans]KAB2954625.1 bifunctional 4-hydroxy-3-methylbut-2-enyl diphosphate reductase/30S ribosomal protein S1 [Heliorestis acidaminivorans]
MQVFLAEHAGFCFGVQRALDKVEEELQKNGDVATYGPLIHNPQVVERLAQQGVKVIQTFHEDNPNRVVIRSHGVGPEVYGLAEQRDFELIDATCPFVKKVQKAAQRFTEEGYQVVVAGDQEHPEVQGIVAWTGGKALVIANQKEAEALNLEGKVALIAQTTLKESTLREIALVLGQKEGLHLEVENTICSATAKRQTAAQKLVEQVDVMVVIGGHNSSNTKKLAQICREAGVPTYHIEKPEELDCQCFQGIQKAGITAGASTPHWIIEEVVQRMSDWNQEGTENKETVEQENAQQPEEVTQEADMEDMGTFEETFKKYEEGQKKFEEGQLITGEVVKVSYDEILVHVGGKSEGVIPRREIAPRVPDNVEEIVKVGQEIPVVVLKAENEDGTLLLSRRRAIEQEKIVAIKEAKERGDIVTGEVIAVVKGGLRVDIGIIGFVPASLIERGYVEDLDQYLGQTLRMKIMEIDDQRNNAVLSQKVVLEEEYQKARKQTWEEIEDHQTRRGTVRRLTDFGAFVDLGGVDGLLHISEMSWGRVKHPSDVVKEGDLIDVYVLKVDRDKEKVSLGLKQVLPNPWSTVTEKYPIDSIIEVTIVRLTTFGAFAELEPGVDGLIHISQLADRRVNKPEDVVSVGQQVKAKVLDIKEDERRISLSMRAVQDDQEQAEVQAYLDNQEN